MMSSNNGINSNNIQQPLPPTSMNLWQLQQLQQLQQGQFVGAVGAVPPFVLPNQPWPYQSSGHFPAVPSTQHFFPSTTQHQQPPSTQMMTFHKQEEQIVSSSRAESRIDSAMSCTSAASSASSSMPVDLRAGNGVIDEQNDVNTQQDQENDAKVELTENERQYFDELLEGDSSGSTVYASTWSPSSVEGLDESPERPEGDLFSGPKKPSNKRLRSANPDSVNFDPYHPKLMAKTIDRLLGLDKPPAPPIGSRPANIPGLRDPNARILANGMLQIPDPVERRRFVRWTNQNAKKPKAPPPKKPNNRLKKSWDSLSKDGRKNRFKTFFQTATDNLMKDFSGPDYSERLPDFPVERVKVTVEFKDGSSREFSAGDQQQQLNKASTSKASSTSH